MAGKDDTTGKKEPGKARARTVGERSDYFPRYCNLCKALEKKKECWWNETTQGSRCTASLETTAHQTRR